jgi:hypothetical protein
VAATCRVLKLARQPYYRWLANPITHAELTEAYRKNVLDRRRWDTREQLHIAIVTWVERTYHRRRRQTTLERLIPIEYKAI